SIDFMAKHGIKGMLALNGEKLTDRIMHQYQELCAKYGRQVQLGQDMCLGMGFVLTRRSKRPSSACAPITMSATSGSPRLALCAIPMNKDARGEPRGRRPACLASKMAYNKKPGSAARLST